MVALHYFLLNHVSYPPSPIHTTPSLFTCVCCLVGLSMKIKCMGLRTQDLGSECLDLSCSFDPEPTAYMVSLDFSLIFCKWAESDTIAPRAAVSTKPTTARVNVQ